MMLYVHDSQGQQRGPFDAATVLAMLQRGEIDDRALCCASGDSQWVNVREHPAVAAIATQPVGADAAQGPRASWGAPATPWSVGGGASGSTWGPSNSIPPNAGFGAAAGSGPAVSAANGEVASAGPSMGAPVATEDEADEDAALGIPVEVTRPPSVVPQAMASGAPSMAAPVASASDGALQGARFMSGAGATTPEQIEARRAERAREGKSRTNLVVATMLGAGVLLLGGLAYVGFSRRTAARAELARASVAQGQVVSSELRESSVVVEVSLAPGTTMRGSLEPAVRCERAAQQPAQSPGAHGERHERWACDVSSAPFGEVQRLRLGLASDYGTSEISATFTRPVSIDVQRDPATGASAIQCRGVACSGTFDARTGLVLTVPARSTVWLGREQREATQEGPMRVALRWDALFANTPTTEVFARDGVIPVELRVSARGAPTLTTRLEVPARVARDELFRVWRAGQPALLPGEAATGAGRRTLVAQNGEAFGAPRQLRDVDLIAYYREQPQSKACRYTIAPRERRTITLRRVDAVLSVFERRTARAVGTRRFNAPWAECPAEFSEAEVAATRFDDAAVRRWLGAFVGG
jgi:hypothetical protein